MNSFFSKSTLLLLSFFLGGITAAHARTTSTPVSIETPSPQQQLFGTFPVATNSAEAREFVELAIEKYENFLWDDAIVHAQHATEKDPHFALAYAVLAFASRRGTPNAAALARAKALLPSATPDEQLLVR